MSEGRFVFYDIESSGVDLDFDQILQLAALETDAELNIITGSETNLLCRPRRDCVPSPDAMLVHQLDLDWLRENGITEYELARATQRLFRGQALTGIAGYNNFAFDDELVRRLMFRNLRPPYEHEFKDGNFRIDVFSLVKMAYAYRPELLAFPLGDDGQTSLKLERLSQANGLVHENAHEAMSDVIATVQLARLIRERCRPMWDYFLSMSDKTVARKMMLTQKPLLYTGGFIERRYRHTSLIQPVVMAENNKNGMLCVDLRYDPTDMLDMSVDELRHYLFTPRHQLEESAPRVPAMNVAMNKQPILLDPAHKLTDVFAEAISIDPGACERHRQQVLNDRGFRERLQQAFSGRDFEPKPDPAASLYTGGFPSQRDKNLLDRAGYTDREAPVDKPLPWIATRTALDNVGAMDDRARYYRLAMRARWNNFANEILQSDLTVSPGELQLYGAELSARLEDSTQFGTGIDLPTARERIQELRMEQMLSPEQEAVLERLEAHYQAMEQARDYFMAAPGRRATPEYIDQDIIRIGKALGCEMGFRVSLSRDSAELTP